MSAACRNFTIATSAHHLTPRTSEMSSKITGLQVVGGSRPAALPCFLRGGPDQEVVSRRPGQGALEALDPFVELVALGADLGQVRAVGQIVRGEQAGPVDLVSGVGGADQD